MVVGKYNPKIFHLHSKLLAHESDHLERSIKPGFKEESDRKIILDDEDPDLFGYFVEYIYRSDWLEREELTKSSDYVILARMYTLGERLQAPRFQHATLLKFTKAFTNTVTVSEEHLCDLLEIVFVELPERVHEDPLRAQVFWCAASRLIQLQKNDYFVRLLEIHKQLGRFLCMRAGNNTNTVQPNKPSETLPSRFRPESIYPS